MYKCSVNNEKVAVIIVDCFRYHKGHFSISKG